MRTKFVLFFSALLLATVLAFSGFSFSPTVHAEAAQSSRVSHPAAAATCPPTISTGSTGWYVSALQTQLNYLYQNYSDSRWFKNSPYDFGPYTQDSSKPLRVDGDFGGHTYNAVRDYQSWNNLTVDGIVGPQTWGSLGFCV